MRPQATLVHPLAALSLAAGLSACVELGPQDREDPVDTGTSDEVDAGEQVWSGSFGEAPLTGAWWVGETWETGGCVELRLQSDGTPIESWGVELLLDAPIESWTYAGGDAQVALEGPEALLITPYTGSESIEAGAARSVTWCSEPLARPAEAFVGFEAGEVVEDPEDEEPDPYDEFAEEPTSGASDAAVGSLSWSFSGSWGYEGCYALSFENTSASPWSSGWEAVLGFAAAAEPLSASGVSWATVDESHLQLASADGNVVPVGGVVSGSLCVERGSPIRSVSLSP